MTDFILGICAYNEVANIVKAVDSVYEQVLDGFVMKEVVVVSSGSTDGTDDAVRSLMPHHPDLRLIVQEKREGKNSAINCLLENKSTEIVAILNADNVFSDSRSLQFLLEPLRDEKVGIVGGHPIPINGTDTVAGVASNMIWIMHHHVSLKYPKIGEVIAFRDIGTRLSSGTQSDEDLLKMGLEKAGYESRYAPDALVRNRGPETVSDFIKQRTRVNIGEYYMRRDNDFYIATQDNGMLFSALKAAFKELRGHSLRLIAAIFLEEYSRMKAKIYVRRNKGDISIWDPVASTKKI